MRKINLALVGATGLVGKTFLRVLQEQKLDNKIKNLYLFASEKSANKTIKVFGKKYSIETLSEENIKNKKIHFAFFAVDEKISKQFAPIFIEQNTIVIDNSSAYRLEKNIPLIVPEINFEKTNSRIIANPNCSTIQAVLPLGVLAKNFGIKRINFATYQAVSGSGLQGLEDLELTTEGKKPKLYPYPIFNNVIPQIGSFNKNGYTSEEMKMVYETQKILGSKHIKISATCVRVPVKNCHSVDVGVELKKKVKIEKIKQLLMQTENIILIDDDKQRYPINFMANNSDKVFVGRLRRDIYNKKVLHFWCVADNLRKGAASNGVQILKKCLEKY